jgi:hypothetical protein
MRKQMYTRKIYEGVRDFVQAKTVYRVRLYLEQPSLKVEIIISRKQCSSKLSKPALRYKKIALRFRDSRL